MIFVRIADSHVRNVVSFVPERSAKSAART
jgi:hypothetical protein